MPATTTPTELRELLRPRVERGAALLDSVEPRWWKRIEEELDLSDCSRCVLGQVYGGFVAGVVQLRRLVDGWGASHGFALDKAVGDVDADIAFAALDDLWLEAIEARRQQ